MKTPGWPEEDLPRGTRVGAYVIRKAIGSGAAQVAYLADSDSGKEVVLKMSLSPMGRKGSSDRKAHDRFMRQVTYFGQLSDAVAVPQMFGTGMFPDASESGYAYLVQEWIPDGLNIVEWAQEKPHELKILVAGWILLAKACEKMTCRGICHRDLKPQNILVRPDGIPKIVDFNSGRSVGAEPLTTDGPRPPPGTTRYYAPEVCWALITDYTAVRRMSFAELATADLHALGVIFYQVLTGMYPFDKHACEADLIEQIACELPDPPRSLNPEVPAGLDEVTMKLLRKDPKKRYQFGDEVAAELWALLKTDEDWTRPFQTPAKEPASAPSRSPTSRTASVPSTSTPMATHGAAAFALGPPPEVTAAPGPLVLLPRPEPQSRPAVLRRALLVAAALIVALGVFSLSAQWHGADPLTEKGTTVVSKPKTAVVAASCMALGCAGLTGKVRTGEKEWLESCPAESREAPNELQIDRNFSDGIILPGPNAIPPPWDYEGFELKDGPVEVDAEMPAPRRGINAILYGTVRTGSDGATIHFHKMKLFQEGDTPESGPSGPKRDICAVAVAPSDPLAGFEEQLRRSGGGIPRASRFPPDFKPHPGFVFVENHAVGLVFAR